MIGVSRYEKGRYKSNKLSAWKRVKLLDMYSEMYSNERFEPMAAKTSVPAQRVKASAPLVSYTTRVGDAVERPVTKLDQTDVYSSESVLWPNLPQRDQREILDENIVIVEVARLTKGPFGPYFCVHAVDSEGGEFTFLSGGEVVNSWIAKLSGINLETGFRQNDGVLPVACRITEVEGDNYTYFNLIPPMEQVESVKSAKTSKAAAKDGAVADLPW